VVVWPLSQWRVLSIPSTFAQPGVDGSAAAPPRQHALAEPPAAGQLSAPVRPSATYLPLAVGVVGAVPLTLLERKARRTVRMRRKGRR
jgi:hypothetical protein